MGFARELKDFAEGFETGADIVDRGRKSKAEWEKHRPISDKDIEGMPDEAEGGGAKIQHVDGGSRTGDGKNDVETNAIAGRLKGDLMRDFKLGDVAAGGIVASLAAESGGFKTLQEINPTVEGSRGGWGYAQWTGPRRKAFEAFAEENGFDPKSYEANYGFLKHELQNTDEGKVLKTLGRARDYRMATQMFTNGFLRPGIPNMEGRYAWADRVGAIDPIAGETSVATADTGTKPAAKKGIEEPEVQETGNVEETPERVADLSPMEVPEQPEVELASWDEFANTDEGFEDQLARAQALQAGGQSPVRPQQAAPVMWAEEGGVIPEPQYFADGGMPQPMQDARQLGLSGGAWPGSVAAPAGGTGPRRVSMPTITAPTYAAGQRTPSQVALDTARSNRAAADAKAKADAEAKAAAEAAKAAQQPAGISKEMMRKLTRARMLGIPLAQGSWESLSAQATPQQYTDLRLQGYGGGFGSSMGNPGWNGAFRRGGSGRAEGGMVYSNFEEGGVIPEPGEDVNFARGGKVEDRDELFQRYLREESRAPGRGGGDSARDRAARRLSASEGRASSTAYSPVNDSEMFTPKTPRGGGGGGKGPGGGKGIDKGKTGSTEKRFPGKEKDDRYIRDQRTKDDRYLDPDLNISRNPYDRRGGAERTPPGRLSDEYVEPNAPRKGPFPRPDARGTLPLKEKPRQKYPRPGLEPQAPASREPVPVEPRPLHTRTPGTTVAPRPDARATPTPERFGRPEPALPAPEEEIIPGAWINGQFVPMNTTAAPGMGFALGGAVPDEEDDVLTSQRDPGYTTSAPGAPSPSSAMPQAERELPATAAAARRAAPVATPANDDRQPERASVRPTPQLVSEVRKAVDGGVRFLTRHFNIGNEGAVPMPEDEATTENGARRFAQGEGAATNEEIAGMDDKVDPNRELDEGKRQMARFAKTMRWYQSRGRTEEAEAAAGSLLQYGAARFSKLGSMSQAAYQQYLNTGDPQHLQKTVQFLEKAYEMVPDGAEVTVQINDQTGKLEVLHEDENGEEEFIEVDPNDLPGVIKGVQDKSMYWNSIFRLADPEGAKSKDIEARQIASDERQEKAGIRREGREQEYELAKEGREAERDKEKAVAEAAAKEAEYQRGKTDELDKEKRVAAENDRQALRNAAITRAQKLAEGNPNVNWDAVNPLLGDVAEAIAADDQEAIDAAASKLWDALPDTNEKATLFEKLAPDAAGAFTYATPPANEMMPEGAPEGTKRMKDPETGAFVWAFPDPTSPSGWSAVE